MADWTVDARPHGGWAVSADIDGDRVTHVAEAIVDDAGRTWVHVDGTVVVVDAPDAPRRRSSHGAANLEAPMPAQVTAILVKAGDRVERGAVLVLLEAMKMELPLRAPTPGVVRTVHCAPGDRVSPGRPLVDLDAQAEP